MKADEDVTRTSIQLFKQDGGAFDSRWRRY